MSLHDPPLGKMTLNPFPNKPWFLRVCSTGPLKTLWEKEKLLVMSNFFFSRSVLYPFRELSVLFIKFEIVVCKIPSVWKGLKFVVWERVKNTAGPVFFPIPLIIFYPLKTNLVFGLHLICCLGIMLS